ncbi:hypothetical protein GCM10011415_02280 [Salipiger pallidus]|uniref:Uncharacterized protein n=1 Tax=Salipiger pallidus TaxID=1775170 RepID=A0A8J3EFH8_9RHOB|nr:hypothetical protein [Salipiger pallidus]GGG59859.1 hypothetical protein GCM10011415_02280 [Salipiger pallidus]
MSSRDDILGRPPKMRRLPRHDQDTRAGLRHEIRGGKHVVTMTVSSGKGDVLSLAQVSLPAAPWEAPR